MSGKPFRIVEGERIERFTPRFKLVRFNELRPNFEADYLVKGLMPRVGLIVLWGPPKSGKSFFIFDLMMHVALNWPYRNLAVQGGPVVYCAFEGGEGLAKRGEAFRNQRLAEDASDIPFYLVAAPMDLAKDHKELIQSIRVQLGETTPVAVVLDTLNRSLAGSESSDADMAAYIKGADAIRDAFDCAVIVVHHCGIEGNRPRGHTSLTGAADAQLSVRRDDQNNVIVAVEWMKDGPEGEILVSRLKSVPIGIDRDGAEITSCVVVEPDEGDYLPRGAGKPKKARTGAAGTALRLLRAELEKSGSPPPACEQIPADAKVISIEQWRQCAYAGGITSSPEPRARQLAFQRAFTRLVNDGEVAVLEDMVWIPSRDHR
jgi:hypothetical protein